MVVKVQLSLITNAGSRMVLVYDQSRSVRYEGTASTELRWAMEGKNKAFFNAKLDEDGYLDLDMKNPLPDPGW